MNIINMRGRSRTLAALSLMALAVFESGANAQAPQQTLVFELERSICEGATARARFVGASGSFDVDFPENERARCAEIAASFPKLPEASHIEPFVQLYVNAYSTGRKADLDLFYNARIDKLIRAVGGDACAANPREVNRVAKQSGAIAPQNDDLRFGILMTILSVRPASFLKTLPGVKGGNQFVGEQRGAVVRLHEQILCERRPFSSFWTWHLSFGGSWAIEQQICDGGICKKAATR